MLPYKNTIESLLQLCSIFYKVPYVSIAVKIENKDWEITELGITGFTSENLQDKNSTAEHIIENPNIADSKIGLPFFQDNKIHFFAQIPIIKNGSNLGYLCLMDTKERSLGKHEKESLVLFAKNISEVISSRKRSEQLEDELMVLNHFIAGTSKTLALIDAETLIFESFNEEFHQITGFKIDKNKNISFLDIISPSDRQEALKAINTVTEGNFLEFDAKTIDLADSIIRFKILRKNKKLYILPRDITLRESKSRNW